MSKTFWAAIAVIAILFGGIIFFNNKNASAPGSANAKPTEHIMGSSSTGVKLVEYGDYQCPYCGRYYPIVKAVADKYKDQIQFQFRHLPLLQVHQNAMVAARATEAAGKQNKFWEMHDLIYQNQSSWAGSNTASRTFEDYAKQLGLNLTQFKTDVASAEINATINADVKEFEKTKEEISTPTFFLDGKKIQPTSVDEFSKLIDAEIKAKQQSSQNTNQ